LKKEVEGDSQRSFRVSGPNTKDMGSDGGETAGLEQALIAM